MREEGLANIFRRHERHAKSVRAAVWEWGLEIVCSAPQEYSNTVTAVFTPEGHDADQLRATILEHFDLSLGAGLGKLAGKVFRIGHLGHLNDLMLAGTLAGIEMGLRLANIPHNEGGVMAALRRLASTGKIAEAPPSGR
jgi:alanine-glyoxylate transaminase / serine-glyoxylate transaminase / serine-pyruvate transaminase